MNPLRIVALFLIIGLTSCCTTDNYDYYQVLELPKDHLLNGCLIDAINYQAVLEAKQDITPTLWSKILIVEFEYNGKSYGHAYCVFMTKDGNLWAYDRTGSRQVYTNKYDALNIALRVHSGITKAWFD